MSRGSSVALRWALGLALLLALALAGLLAWQRRPPPWADALAPGAAAPSAAAAEPVASADLLQRGALLARAGHCAGCHTERGGAAMAGGRAIATPFGEVRAANLTPDAATGLGQWRETDFRRALQHGQSRDGRLLLPACPYPHFTRVSDDDVRALWAWLRSQPPVAQARQPHALAWPYNTPLAIALWRSLYFRPGRFEPDPSRSEQVNRGAYLVEGLDHCGACHGQRGPLGGTSALGSAGGAVMPDQRWYAPSLTDAAEGGVPGRDVDELLQLLKTGVSARATVMGPMAAVVAGSTQYLTEADLRAMVAYLQQLPATPPAAPAAPRSGRWPRDAQAQLRGQQLYQDLCADCHGDQGQGAAGIYPPLADNPTVTMTDSRNLLQAIRRGGFAPATAGNPRPYGMPSFDLADADLAALASWLRAAWGHDAAPVQAVQVLLAR